MVLDKNIKRKYYLQNYDPNWIKKFDEIKLLLESLFGDKALKIEHIGSTSIPGLSAKPIIDIAVMIETSKDVDDFTELLALSGYRFDSASTERHFYRKGEPVEYHLSISYRDRGGFWARQILFRDYLKSHPELVKEYEELKIENLKVTPEDDFEDLSFSENYNRGKSEFVKKVLDLAEKEKISPNLD